MSVELSGVRTAFFDFDDTLVATIQPKWAQHKFIAKKYYEKDLTDDELINNWGMPVEEMVKILYGTKDYDEARVHILRHREEYPKVLFDASIPTMLELKKRGFLTGVITATNRESIELDFRLLEFTGEHFDYVQTMDDTDVHKPDPEVFRPAIKWLEARELNPEQAVYIGDSLRDMNAALGAGFKFIGVETGLVTRKEFRDFGVVSVANVGGILEIIP